MSIAIVDYSAGNLASVQKALRHLGARPVITSDPGRVAEADKIIVPGMGHFAATQRLSETGLGDAVWDAMQRGKPVLGICLGMQWLFASSEEALGVHGLGIFSEGCGRFPVGSKSPHVGWNDLQLQSPSILLQSIPPRAFVYFTHSYRAPVVQQTVATCEYAGTFSAVVEHDRIFGVQFHPEKSGAVGLRLLFNFCDLPC